MFGIGLEMIVNLQCYGGTWGYKAEEYDDRELFVIKFRYFMQEVIKSHLNF